MFDLLLFDLLFYLKLLLFDLFLLFDLLLLLFDLLFYLKQRNQVVILKSEAGLRVSLNPFYYDLFNVIARLEGGIKFLVDMRGDLLVSVQRLVCQRSHVPRSGWCLNITSDSCVWLF